MLSTNNVKLVYFDSKLKPLRISLLVGIINKTLNGKIQSMNTENLFTYLVACVSTFLVSSAL